MALRTKLELVAIGASSYEREFLADTLLPNNKTVGDTILPMLQESYSSGRAPLLLEAITGR